MDNITDTKDYSGYLDPQHKKLLEQNKDNKENSNNLNEKELKEFKEILSQDIKKLNKKLHLLYKEEKTNENYNNLILINSIKQDGNTLD
jgi:flagellar hook-basal body complex protein FliE